MGLNQHLSDTVSTAKVVFARQSQSRGEHVRMMYRMDVNRRKWRCWWSAHVQCVRGQLTFQRNGLHFKYRMFLLQGFDYEARQKGDLDSAAVQVV